MNMINATPAHITAAERKLKRMEEKSKTLLIKENRKGEINWPAKSALVLRDNAQPLKSELT